MRSSRPIRRRWWQAGLWLLLAGFLTWLTFACLFGHVNRRLSPDEIRVRGRVSYMVLPAPPRLWPLDLHADVLENGRSLSERGCVFPPILLEGASSAPRLLVVRFRATDRSSPVSNGRTYALRYRRLRSPSALILLLACWSILPALLWWRLRREREPESPTVRSATRVDWSVLVLGLLFSVFAVQAWLPASNAAWFLALAAVGVPPFLERVSRGVWTLPRWSPWLAGFLAWAAFSSIGGTSYASLSTASRLLAACAVGAMLYLGLRGSLVGREGRASSLLLVILAIAVGLSLARDAGFDIVGWLSTLGLTAKDSGRVVNLWTTKFTSHWVLVVAWGALVALGRLGKPRRGSVALVALLVLLALGSSGSKTAVSALLLSAVVAVAALRWPGGVRRLVMYGLVFGVLLAPLLAAVPWRIESALPSSWRGAVGVFELDVRGGIWEFSRQLVSLHPLVGWGLGATGSLPGQHLSMAHALGIDPASAGPVLASRPILLGGHPHDAALLTWLDLGLIGALLLAGLLVAMARGLAATEEKRLAHASLLGLLTVTAVFLVFNYPVWEPEVMALLWMSATLVALVLPRPVAARESLVRGAVAVVVLLAIGCGLLSSGRLSLWLTERRFRIPDLRLDVAGGTLSSGGEVWRLEQGVGLDAGAELVRLAPGGSAYIWGWAYGRRGAFRPREVLVFLGSHLVGIVRPERPSPRVFVETTPRDIRALTSGFLIPVQPGRVDLDAPVTLVALGQGRMRAVELRHLGGGVPGRDDRL